MLSQIIKYAWMPEPITMLGILFIIYAMFTLLALGKDGYFNNIFSGVIWQLRQKYKLLLLMGLGVLFTIYFIDRPIALLCKLWYNSELYTILDFVGAMGEGWFIIGGLFTLSIIYESLGKFNHATILKFSYVAAASAGLYNAVLKLIFNRQRPSIALAPEHFFYFFTSSNRNLIDLTYVNNSMPSGHTIMVFAAITPLILYIKSPLYRFLMLGFAVTIGIARIYTLNHWLSDVCVSAILGTIIGLAIYQTNLYRIETQCCLI